MCNIYTGPRVLGSFIVDRNGVVGMALAFNAGGPEPRSHTNDFTFECGCPGREVYIPDLPWTYICVYSYTYKGRLYSWTVISNRC